MSDSSIIFSLIGCITKNRAAHTLPRVNKLHRSNILLQVLKQSPVSSGKIAVSK